MIPSDILSSALSIMAWSHAKQVDKAGMPYVLHPLEVMRNLGPTKDKELQCIALLHDVIEDTDTDYTDLRSADMSERVIAGVRALTKVKGQTYEQYKAAVKANPDAVRVKLADLGHNCDLTRLDTPTAKDLARVEKYLAFAAELRALV